MMRGLLALLVLGLLGSALAAESNDMDRRLYLRYCVVEVIDGRNTVRAHGDPNMPVWREIFEGQAGWDAARRIEARGRIMLIADYLRSIQEK